MALVTLDQVLAVPYVLDVSTRAAETGQWVCRLEYPELPGCVAEDRNVLAALDHVERLREQWLRECVARGDEVPLPRRALSS